MKYGQFDEEFIEKHLNSFCENDSFFILQLAGEGSEVVSYIDDSGTAMNLMIDDNSLSNACLKYLTGKGVPVMKDATQFKEYQAEMRQKVLNME